MSVTISPLTLDGFDALPAHVRKCVFWEVDPANLAAHSALTAPELVGFDSEFDKEAWVSMVLLEWGTCGQVAVERRTGKMVGTAFYAPPGRVPRARHFPTAPVSPDAVLLTSMRANPGLDGVAETLVQSVIDDLIRRGVRAVEAFGIVRSTGDDDPTGLVRQVQTCGNCMIDAHFLTDAGFEIVAAHPRFPRLRFELDEGLGWKAEVESALARLVLTAAIPAGTTHRETAPQPVPIGLH